MRFRLALLLALGQCSELTFAGNELAGMDLEQLMDMNVTTVSKREQSFSSAAAAIYTISQEDIRRSAATNLPEILQQAPGVEVARINPSMWAVTARGFNSQFANKLLVLIDGRSIYTPLFSGVYWDEQMPLLDDIQRIEIIRGPGASLWGSNAVNGVINIITYDSEQTTGSHVVAGGGNEERGFVRARQGFRQGNLTGRVSAQQRRVDEGIYAGSNEAANDDYVASAVDTRLDWRPSTGEKLTLNAGMTETDKHTDIALRGDIADIISQREDLGARGSYLLINCLHELNDGDALFLQAYADYDHRYDSLESSERLTSDFELQYNHREMHSHRLTWGLNHRNTRDKLQGSFVLYAEDPTRSYALNTAFLQDEYHFSESLGTTLGMKVEESNTDRFEYQPTLRVSWQALENSTFWASASRAARTPSRLENSLEFRAPAISGIFQQLSSQYPDYRYYSVIRGSKDFNSEILNAYELGWRWQMNSKTLLDITTYQNVYSKLLTYIVLPSPENPDLRYIDQGLVGIVGKTVNQSHGRSSGVELALDYFASEQWKLKATYTYFNFDSSHNPVDTVNAAEGFEKQSPENQLRLTSSHTLGQKWEFDWTLRYVDELFDGFIPAYTDLDIRIARKITPDLSISLVGKSLLDPRHPEFADNNYGPFMTEMQRSAFLQIDWRKGS